MEEEDYEVIRAARNASPHRFAKWDRTDSFKRQYSTRHSNDEPARLPDRHDGRSPSRASSAQSVVLEEIGMARPSRHRMGSTATEPLSSRPGLERHPTALSRIQTHRSQHLGTVGSNLRARQSRQSKPLPNFGDGKDYPPLLPDREEYVVEFDGHEDPLHAQNWPMRRKIWIGVILAFDSLAATMGSSIFSPGIVQVATEFNVSREVGTLGTSFFVLGYAFGPLMWAPASELYGRRLPIVIAVFGFSIFSLAVAVGKDLQTILICRFFCGIFGSCPLAVVAAVFADMFSNKLRGLAIAVFSATIFMGPLLAPFIGGFITISYLGWRWTEYISAIMGATAFILVALFLPETYPPVILVGKAAELRRRTKNWGIHAKQEEVEVDFKELLTKNISRPLRILFTEPIVFMITLYMSFIYGLLYLFLTAYALVFQGVYGMNAGVGGLCYFGMIAGEIIAFIVIVATNPRYIRKLEANNDIPVPEWRLPIAIVGGVVFAAGLFWFGWTGYTNSVPWIVPALSGLFTGFGIFSIFLSLLNYIVDAYLMFAASALAGNTFLRSIFGAIFPLFAVYMFDGMGIQWAATLLGCVAAILVPLPIYFLIYGKKIRGKSKFAPAPDIEQDKTRDEESKGSDSLDSGVAAGKEL